MTDTGPVERFARLSSKLIARTDMADIANAAVPELAALMQAKYSLLLWRPSGTDTPLCASNLPSGFPAREYGLHLVNLLYGKRVSVASSGPMRWVEDIESEPGFDCTLPFAQTLGCRACAVAPLLAHAVGGGTTLGIAGVLFPRPRHYMAAEASLLEGAAGTIGLALSNLLLVEQVNVARQQADEAVAHDHLTGLASRGVLLDCLAREIAAARRHERPLSVLMIDVDGLKRVNDSLGHQAGDRVLRELAGEMGRRVRAADVLGRYGGDEFLAVLPDTEPEGASQLAARLLHAVRHLQPASDNGSLNVSISVGSATHDGRVPLGGEELILNADKALYDAKRSGGDCHVSAGSPARRKEAAPTSSAPAVSPLDPSRDTPTEIRVVRGTPSSPPVDRGAPLPARAVPAQPLGRPTFSRPGDWRPAPNV